MKRTELDENEASYTNSSMWGQRQHSAFWEKSIIRIIYGCWPDLHGWPDHSDVTKYLRLLKKSPSPDKNGIALEIFQCHLLVLHVYAIDINRMLHTASYKSSFMRGVVTPVLRSLSSFCNWNYFLKYQHETVYLLRQTMCIFMYIEKYLVINRYTAW